MGRHRRWLVVSATAVVALAGCAGAARQRVTAGPTATTIASSATTATGAGVGATLPLGSADSAVTTTLASPATTAVLRSTTTVPRPETPVPAPATTTTAAVGGGGGGGGAAACGATLAAQLATTGGGTQLITVVAAGTGSTSATITLWQRSAGCWTPAAGPWTGRMGYAGLSTHHQEGDGTTPIGLYGVSSAFYGLAPDPGVHGSYHQLVCGDWWDEDPASAQYNTFQHVACGSTPAFGGGSEELWTQTTAYQRFAVVDYNTGPVVPGAGSGIFIHDDTGGGTNGCVSLPNADLDTLLRWLQPGQSPHIAIATTSTISQY